MAKRADENGVMSCCILFQALKIYARFDRFQARAEDEESIDPLFVSRPVSMLKLLEWVLLGESDEKKASEIAGFLTRKVFEPRSLYDPSLTFNSSRRSFSSVVSG